LWLTGSLKFLLFVKVLLSDLNTEEWTVGAGSSRSDCDLDSQKTRTRMDCTSFGILIIMNPLEPPLLPPPLTPCPPYLGAVGGSAG
jgi:hypothetical protein